MRAYVAAALLVSLTACDDVFGLDRPPLDGGTAGTDGTDTPDDADDGDPSLVAWFKLDGVPVVDSSRFGHVGACTTCPMIVPGRVDTALRFNGGASIAVNASVVLETTSAFTVMGWFRPMTSGANDFRCGFNKAFEKQRNSWQACFDAENHIQFLTSDEKDDALAGPVLPDDEWHHIALWWDGTTKAIFVNGLRTTSIIQPTEFNMGIVGIGADYDGGTPSAAYVGDLDDLRIYNRALAADEILMIASQI